MSARRRSDIDVVLLSVTLILVLLGLIMVYSSSAIWADKNLGNSAYYLKRQLVWAALGLTAMAALSSVDYNRWKEWVAPILILTIMGLTAALFTAPIAGVRRWIRFGPIGLQPSEFAKITVVLFWAHYLDRKRSKLDSPLKGLAVPGVIVGLLLVLIGLEPDLGTPVLLFTVSSLILFVGGGNLRHIAAAVLLSLPVLAYELLRYPYRRARLFHYFSAEGDASGAGYQVSQALLAIGSGGWLGQGLGASKLKLMYLPAPHTDFIFPVLCEEIGLLGALTCLALFAAVLIRGARIARSAPNLFGTLLASGLTYLICLQAFYNIGMAMGLLPTKGIPLPFISFGGSSLLVSLCCVGILLNISRQSRGQANFAPNTRGILEVPAGARRAEFLAPGTSAV